MSERGRGPPPRRPPSHGRGGARRVRRGRPGRRALPALNRGAGVSGRPSSESAGRTAGRRARRGSSSTRGPSRVDRRRAAGDVDTPPISASPVTCTTGPSVRVARAAGVGEPAREPDPVLLHPGPAVDQDVDPAHHRERPDRHAPGADVGTAQVDARCRPSARRRTIVRPWLVEAGAAQVELGAAHHRDRACGCGPGSTLAALLRARSSPPTDEVVVGRSPPERGAGGGARGRVGGTVARLPRSRGVPAELVAMIDGVHPGRRSSPSTRVSRPSPTAVRTTVGDPLPVGVGGADRRRLRRRPVAGRASRPALGGGRRAPARVMAGEDRRAGIGAPQGRRRAGRPRSGCRRGRCDPQLAAVLGHHGGRRSRAQAGAAGAARPPRVTAGEALGDVGQQVGRDPGAVVGTRRCTVARSRGARRTETVVPGGVWVRALASRLLDDLVQALRVADDVELALVVLVVGLRHVQRPAVLAARRRGRR